MYMGTYRESLSTLNIEPTGTWRGFQRLIFPPSSTINSCDALIFFSGPKMPPLICTKHVTAALLACVTVVICPQSFGGGAGRIIRYCA